MSNQRRIDPVVAFGVVASIGLGAILALLTSLKVLEAFAVSLAGVMVTLLVDIIARVERRHSEEDEQARLAATIRRVDGMFPKFEGLARAIASIEHGSHSVAFKKEAARNVDELVRKLEELERQELRVPVDDTQLLFEQFAHTRNSLHAVSIDALDSAWRWSNDTGARYWRANEEALEKGVKIERVFVYKILTKDLLDNVERQLQRKIKVFVVQEDRVRPELRNDVAVWDEGLVSHTQLNTAGLPIYNVYSTEPFEVNRRFREFCQVRDSAYLATDEWIQKERSRLTEVNDLGGPRAESDTAPVAHA